MIKDTFVGQDGLKWNNKYWDVVFKMKKKNFSYQCYAIRVNISNKELNEEMLGRCGAYAIEKNMTKHWINVFHWNMRTLRRCRYSKVWQSMDVNTLNTYPLNLICQHNTEETHLSIWMSLHWSTTYSPRW